MIVKRIHLYKDDKFYGEYANIGAAKCGIAQARKRYPYKDPNVKWEIKEQTLALLSEGVVWKSYEQ